MNWLLTFLLALAPTPDLRQHRATVSSCYDADTCTVDFHLKGEVGLGVSASVTLAHQKVRLYGIDAPELRGEEREKGLVARDWLRARVTGRTLRVDVLYDSKGRPKKGKYGRWIVVLYRDGADLNDELVKLGHAVSREY